MIPKSIIISRTDNLGDVMLTLPLCGYIKKVSPSTKIYFLGKAYTKPLISACKHVDEFILYQEELTSLPHAEGIIHVFPNKLIAKLAKKNRIPIRVGTSHRLYHWKYCNKLIGLSRKKSDLHESQLNILLFQKAFELSPVVSLTEIKTLYGFEKLPNKSTVKYFKPEKRNIIIHPKSKGSAREWPTDSYLKLVKNLGSEYNILITGTESEGLQIKNECPDLLNQDNTQDLTGKISLSELISLIQNADALIACSTGPIHIAAASKILTIGLYPPMRPIHPGRWSPQGEKVNVLYKDINCSKCRKTEKCECIKSIKEQQIISIIKKELV